MDSKILQYLKTEKERCEKFILLKPILSDDYYIALNIRYKLICEIIDKFEPDDDIIIA